MDERVKKSMEEELENDFMLFDYKGDKRVRLSV